MTTDILRTVRRRFTVAALLLPAAIVAASVLLQVVLLPRVPAVVATHWSWDGVADGFSPAWTVPLATTLLGLGLPVLLFATCIGALRRGDHGSTFRVLGGVALGVAVLVASLGATTIALQTGSTDASQSALPTLLIPALLGAATLAGIGGWGFQPHVPWRPTPSAVVPTVPITPGERVVWMQRAVLARSGRILLLSTVALTALTVVALLTTGSAVATWIGVAATAVLALSVLANTRFHVRVDPDGLLVTSALGWPRVHVPLDQVVSAEVVQVAPMTEFGGWGLRWGPDGRFGVVLRAGEGLLVHRRDGRSVTVTVDDPATAAGLLHAYAALTPGPARD